MRRRGRSVTKETLSPSAQEGCCYSCASLMDGLVRMHVDGRILDFNESYRQVLGYDRRRLLSLSHRALMPRKWHRSYSGILEQVLQRGWSQPREIEYLRADGTACPVRLLMVLQRDKSGSPVALMAVVRETSHLAQVAGAPVDCRALFSIFMRYLPAAAFIKDQEGKLVFMNKYLQELFGVQDWEGRLTPELVAGELGRQMSADDRKAMDRGILTLEESVTDSRGNTRSYKTVKFSIPTGQEPLLGGIAVDVTQQKRSEEAIREQEARIQSITDNLVSGMILQLTGSEDGYRKFTYLSDAVRRLHGVSPEEALADSSLIFSRIHPEDRLRLAREELEALRTFSTFKTEVRFMNPSGTVRWSSLVSNPRRLADGSIVWDGIEFDITERKQMEEQLRHSEAALRQAQKVAKVGSWVYHVQENRVECSDELLRIYGIDRESFSGDVNEIIAKVVHPADRAAVQEACESATSRGGGSRVEYRAVQPDGTALDLWAEPGEDVRDKDGNLVLLTGIVQDITDRKRAEAELREAHDRLEERVAERTRELARANEDLRAQVERRARAEEQVRRSETLYRTTIDAMDEALHVVEPDLRIGMYNQKMAQMCERLGVDAPQVGGTVLQAFPFLPESVQREYRRVFRSGKPLLSQEWSRVGGQEVCTSTRKIPIMEGGKVARVITVMNDITERKRTEDALRKARNALAKAREEERKRIAGELHDSLGQVLAVAAIRVQDALEALTVDTDPVADSLRGVIRLLKQMSTDVRHLAHGLYPTTLESFGLVSELAVLVQQVDTTRLRASLRCSMAARKIRLGPEQEIGLFRIAQEALTNAIRHSGARHVTVGLGCSSGKYRLAVVDDGKGFDNTSPGRDGSGLVSMQERAEAIGATLLVNSKPGRTSIEARVDVSRPGA